MNDQAEADPAPRPKIDPETLVLRATPRKAVRFRRSAVIAAAALGSVAIVGVAWLGLRPTSFRMVAEASDKIDGAAPPEQLANAPKSYGDVPKLGAPLPGDLGRPILAHQRAVMATEPAIDRSAQAVEAERQRLEADRKAARESGVMMQIASAGSAGQVGGAASLRAAMPDEEAASDDRSLDIDRTADPNGQRRKASFLRQADAASDVNPGRLVGAPSPYTLSAGSTIAASLITGLNSDLPGLVTAQISENAYDSATGKILLIPQGARLIGRHDSVVAFGQSRALVTWNRIVMPDGSSIRIDNMPATDTSGYAGLSDSIDRHTWQLLKGVALSTLLGVGTEISFGDERSDLVRALRQSAQQNGARAGDQIVGRSLDIQPTLKVRPGWPLRVVIHKDLILAPWAQRGVLR
ncbi:TrbI/VirB10 family protein [Novosphingobium sp. JCM 18896]|uniref:TrbI/VirB10 family protein n=1 Tax=Novosphingobium sp. JCM 18896 TaxID=2989731 RepID=UPI002221650D|nr:TrbI/VirB10 family protein [Novosphingobium sp. JCM 18896]MCW1430917.1 conjugal transfer protein TrbI [Novosphingobium sp. JCM 18896]